MKARRDEHHKAPRGEISQMQRPGDKNSTPIFSISPKPFHGSVQQI